MKWAIATTIMPNDTTAMLRLCSTLKRTITGDAATSAALGAMAQQVVGQHHRHHGLGDWRAADADAGVVASLGAQLDLVAEAVDALDVAQDRAGRLDDHATDDVLAGRDAAQDAAGMIAEEGRRTVFHAHLVG